MLAGARTSQRHDRRWNEDTEQEEYKFARYLESKQNGDLVSRRLASKNNRSRQRVPLAYKGEGEPIRFGDSIMLQSVHANQFLSVEPSTRERVKRTTAQSSPTASNVFIVTKVPGSKGAVDDDGVLRYGCFCLTSGSNPHGERRRLAAVLGAGGRQTLDWATPFAFGGLVVGSAGVQDPLAWPNVSRRTQCGLFAPCKDDDGWMAVRKSCPCSRGSIVLFIDSTIVPFA